MNETVLALVSALAIYGLSSLALPRPSVDPRDDSADVQTEESADTAPIPPSNDAA